MQDLIWLILALLLGAGAMLTFWLIRHYQERGA
jgi:hypothetical protein